jgi:Fe-S-cluster containining protein
VAKKKLTVLYDCLNCTAYCCTYGHIHVTKADIRRLAKHFDVSEAKAEKKFTKKGDKKGTRVLRHKFDAIFESACMFLDQETRQCTIHLSRPGICREYPGAKRCEYYDFLQAERGRQNEPDMVVAAYPVDM